MVSFLDDPEDYATQEMVVNMDAKIKEVMEFWNRVQALDKDLCLNPLYVSKTLKQSQKGAFMEGGDVDDQDMILAQQLSMQDHQGAMRHF